MAHILTVDDELEVLSSIKELLEDEGHDVQTESNSLVAWERIKQEPFDLIILDIIMPDLNGIELCQRIRANPYLNHIGILFLTAKGRAEDIAKGLDAGGDDYLTKPFQIIELPARVRALLRRTPQGGTVSEEDCLTVKNVTLHMHRLEVEIDSNPIYLTAAEHRLLYYLMQQDGQPVSVDTLLQNVWEYPPGVGDPALVYRHIANLRAKIEPDPEKPYYIRSISKLGYIFGL